MGSARLAWLTGPDIRDDVNPGGAHQLKDQPADGSKTPSWRAPDTEPPRRARGLAPSPAPSQENSASKGGHLISSFFIFSPASSQPKTGTRPPRAWQCQ